MFVEKFGLRFDASKSTYAKVSMNTYTMKIAKLPVKKLIEFRRLPERRQNTFVKNLIKPKEPKEGGGGDYWIRSISAISTAFKQNDNTIIRERLDGLIHDHELSTITKTKVMHKRNIDILEPYVDFDFTNWRPPYDLDFISRPSNKSIIKIGDLPIQIRPNHVFTFGNKEDKRIGGIWLVTWLEGFKASDLGVYSEALYRYLLIHYSENYPIDMDFCTTIDVSSFEKVGYNKIRNGEIPSNIDTVIKKLNNHLKKYR